MLVRGQTTEERIAQIASGFGQGVQNYQQGQDRQRAQGLQAEATRRQQAMQELEIEGKLSEQTGKNLVGSGIGKQYLTSGMAGIGELMNSAPTSRKAELEQARADREARKDESIINKNNRLTSNAQPSYEQKLAMKTQNTIDAKNTERQDPVYKLEKLGAEGRGKVGAIASGFQALDQMIKSGADNYGPQHIDSNTPGVGRLISDNPYSEGERLLTEVVGRLQSGGAIGEPELKTFRALGPKPGDDKESVKRKLTQQKDFLQNKLTAFSLNNDDMKSLGFEMESKYVPKNGVNMEEIKKASRADKVKYLESLQGQA
jgi:hypothetical protein